MTSITRTGCLEWLNRKGAKGLDKFIVKPSPTCVGAGCFASRDILAGEVLFTIPQSCIFSLVNTENTCMTKILRHYATSIGNPKIITSELLIWLHMCESNIKDFGHLEYFNSLDNIPPNVLNWSGEDTFTLSGTNLDRAVNQLMERVKTLAILLDDIRRYVSTSISHLIELHVCEEDYIRNFDEHFPFTDIHLKWAIGHYLSRRYPGKFAHPASLGPEGRESGMGNIGALVPFLDILNHNPDKEWLSFRLQDGALVVVSNVDVKQVRISLKYPHYCALIL
jgi:hypothetical protein